MVESISTSAGYDNPRTVAVIGAPSYNHCGNCPLYIQGAAGMLTHTTSNREAQRQANQQIANTPWRPQTGSHHPTPTSGRQEHQIDAWLRTNCGQLVHSVRDYCKPSTPTHHTHKGSQLNKALLYLSEFKHTV